MRPHFNGNPNNQLKNNGTNASMPQQVMGNPGSFCPNPIQIRPQFQMGALSPQLAMPTFPNPNAYFAPTQHFPFPQAHVQGLNPMFAHNLVNAPQLLHNGQFNGSNLVQNVSQLLQMQIASFGPQNFANLQPNMVNGNGNLQHLMNGNISKQIHIDDKVEKDFGASQQQNLHMFSNAEKLQSNAGEFRGTNNNWTRSNKKNLIGNFKGDGSQRGFVKQQFPQKQYSKGNFKLHNANQGKGSKNETKTCVLSDTAKQFQGGKERPLSLNYTVQEIQQWREQRKKNYPSKANMEKKLKDNSMRSEITDTVAKIRRQELKEILEKQAELGCEVAEIPSCYLSDSERQTDGRVEGQNIFQKRERFQNKFDKRGKFRHKDQVLSRHTPSAVSANFHDRDDDSFAKKQRLASGSIHLDRKKDPSLLQKLLYSDIKRDKTYLLQIFRFMVMNSFFDDQPSKPLRFPVVIMKESGDEIDCLQKKHQVAEYAVSTSAGSDLVIRSGGQSLQEEVEITI
ncbi:hypothetical protein F511_22660 [Dorcoceras hygrometricum]|uniref:FMR1-interacting protein 1 conserved domain-containing protein n=1 Tax=Dorcoceras hygrometricum TaxID=472368 RepID=A0A2Z7BM73_9LAMI|nr:hypothetical protein F511_22660 [Dorcoceras hygrometricum]